MLVIIMTIKGSCGAHCVKWDPKAIWLPGKAIWSPGKRVWWRPLNSIEDRRDLVVISKQNRFDPLKGSCSYPYFGQLWGARQMIQRKNRRNSQKFSFSFLFVVRCLSEFYISFLAVSQAAISDLSTQLTVRVWPAKKWDVRPLKRIFINPALFSIVCCMKARTQDHVV